MWIRDVPIFLGMVFMFCSQIAEAGGIIVPDGKRARKRPAPCWGCEYIGLGGCSGLGIIPNRPGVLWGGATCPGVTYLLLEDKRVIHLPPMSMRELVNAAFLAPPNLGLVLSGRQRWRRHWSDFRARRECRESLWWTQKVWPPSDHALHAGRSPENSPNCITLAVY